MAPTHPGTKPKGKTSAENGYPGLSPQKAGEAKSKYEEIQEDELLALESIYGDDFHKIETKSTAWKKTEPAFSIRVRSPDGELAITLLVTLVATYPKSPPLLSLKDDKDIAESIRFKLNQILENKPKELILREEAMIMDIVDLLRDVLDEASAALAAGRALPSLEEERAVHETEAARMVQKQQQEEERKKDDEKMEEDRVLDAMIQEELSRQKAKSSEAKKKLRQAVKTKDISLDDGALDDHEIVVFDQPLTLVDERNNSVPFQAVAIIVRIRTGPASDCFTVRPIVKDDRSQVLVLKRSHLSGHAGALSSQFKAQLRALENELEAAKKCKHANILQVFDFKIQKVEQEEGASSAFWTMNILTEYGNKGSLEEILDIAGDLNVDKVRAWTIELLDALRYLHDCGIIHKDLRASNIILVRSPSGHITAKLADAGFQRLLHDLKSVGMPDTLTVAKSTYWLAPETTTTPSPGHTQKADIWDLGVVFLQMLFGLGVLQKYATPERVTDALDLSEPLSEIIQKFFRREPKKRPRAVELSSSVFLATDAPIMAEESSAQLSRIGSATTLHATPSMRQRHDSMNIAYPHSRYRADFVEVGLLGKGGFGEVVKVRKKLDGQFYAIKKITQKPNASLSRVLAEVRFLSQLNHSHVVRYFNTWTEETAEEVGADGGESYTFDDSMSAVETGGEVELPVTTGGLDFISSSGYQDVEFGYDTDENAIMEEDEETEEDDDEEDGDGRDIKGSEPARSPYAQRVITGKIRSDSHSQKSTNTILYIQMEFCEKRTLRDWIGRGLYEEHDEIWRLLRQILEGLAHIHGLNVVHRDLKPENIFIDGALNVRIGDFGLATAGQQAPSDRLNPVAGSHRMTTSIGTPNYAAPEISSIIGSYTSKADMYSLGIIFFEMCYHPMLGMERADVLQKLRQKQPSLPSDFPAKEKAIKSEIILSLVNHDPSVRPGSSELLKGGKLPIQMESETIRQTLAGMADPKSPYHEKMMDILFSRPPSQVKDHTWDMGGSANDTADDLLLQSAVKQKLSSIFRRHGALEAPRMMLFPRSSHYGPNAVQLLDASGTLVQLPYDLVLPHARHVAKHTPPLSRSYTFGTVFRDTDGGQPRAFGEIDFDIVSDSLDLALKDAEAIKVLDEIVMCFPSLKARRMIFHINHADLLGLILEFCRIDLGLRPKVTEVLSRLNVGRYTWQQIRNELRSPVGIAATSLDDLQRFDFKDTPQKAFQKLNMIFDGTDIFARAAPAIAHLKEVIAYLKRLDVHCQVFINPLSTFKDVFFQGGIMFKCASDTKNPDILAAGGRYDSLIREHRAKMGSKDEDRHAVGFSLTSEKITASMKRFQKTGSKAFLKKTEDDESANRAWSTKRCDVLVASFDASILRSTGLEILQQLWAEDITGELATDARSAEDLLSKYRDDQHNWVVIVKQDLMLKVKSVGRRNASDVDLPLTQLLPWLRAEIREREQREGSSDRARLLRQPTQAETSDALTKEQEVRVLMAQTKSKKSNRLKIVESAHTHALSLVQSFLDGPILAIETSDHALGLIRETRLSDPDSWRKVSQSVPSAERRYIGEIHDVLKTLAVENKDLTRNAFVYNFRSGTCIYYDMGL